MSAIVATKAALAALPIDQLRLHFVAENDCWYYGDPALTDTADGENIIAPTTGPGRYRKGKSQNNQNSLTPQAITASGNFPAVQNSAYFFDFAAIGTDLTLTLPSSPDFGSVIQLVYGSATNIQRRLIVAPGSRLVNGQSGNFFLYRQNHSVDLVWLGATLGWQYKSNYDLSPLPVGTLTTINTPANTSAAQNGLINFIGCRFNLSNSYVNPFLAPLANNVFLFWACQMGINTAAGTVDRLGDRASTGITLYNPGFITNSGPAEVTFLLPCNNADQTKQYPIKLSSIYWQGTNLTTAQVTHIVVQGTNDFIESSTDWWKKPSNLLSNYQARTTRDLNGITGSADWKTIAKIPVSSLTIGTGNFGSVANSAYLIPVNSGQFYTAHRILFIYQTAYTSGINISELEMYGDIIVS